MTDLNFKNDISAGTEAGNGGDEKAQLYEATELLFFAYRDFISEPDEILAEFDFGRAHHRVIHFISRNPGIKVADLLDILRITKQSLGRVLKQLIRGGFVYQREGPSDRRQRLLHLTQSGHALAARLAAPQFERIRAALHEVGPQGEAAFLKVLFHLINEKDREMVSRIAFRGRKDKNSS